MKISKEAKVGGLAVLALAIFYIGFNFLKGIDFFSSTNTYHAIYEEVDGLTVSNKVMLSGLSVGRVSEIEILQEQNNKIKVYFDIREDIALGEGSVAQLSTDLLGTQTVVLIPKDRNNPLGDGGELTGTVESSLTEQIQEQAYPVLKNLDSVALHINEILENINQNENNINAIISDIRTSTAALSEISSKQREITQLIDNFKKISASLSDDEDGLGALMGKANTIADSLKALQLNSVVQRLDSSLMNVNTLLAEMHDGEGTVDKLLDNDSLYVNLNNTAESLDKLLIDFRENPKRYVHFSLFGGKNKDKKKE